MLTFFASVKSPEMNAPVYVIVGQQFVELMLGISQIPDIQTENPETAAGGISDSSHI